MKKGCKICFFLLGCVIEAVVFFGVSVSMLNADNGFMVVGGLLLVILQIKFFYDVLIPILRGRK